MEGYESDEAKRLATAVDSRNKDPPETLVTGKAVNESPSDIFISENVKDSCSIMKNIEDLHRSETDNDILDQKINNGCAVYSSTITGSEDGKIRRNSESVLDSSSLEENLEHSTRKECGCDEDACHNKNQETTFPKKDSCNKDDVCDSKKPETEILENQQKAVYAPDSLSLEKNAKGSGSSAIVQDDLKPAQKNKKAEMETSEVAKEAIAFSSPPLKGKTQSSGSTNKSSLNGGEIRRNSSAKTSAKKKKAVAATNVKQAHPLSKENQQSICSPNKPRVEPDKEVSESKKKQKEKAIVSGSGVKKSNNRTPAKKWKPLSVEMGTVEVKIERSDGSESKSRKQQVLNGLAKSSFVKKQNARSRAFDRKIQKMQAKLQEYFKYYIRMNIVDDTAVVDDASAPAKGKQLENSMGKRRNGMERDTGDGRKMARQARSVGQCSHSNYHMKYSKEELEGLRFVNAGEQDRLWKMLYNSFGDIVKREYDELTIPANQRNPSVNCTHQTHIVTTRYVIKKKEPGSQVVGGSSSDNSGIDPENQDEKNAENVDNYYPDIVESDLVRTKDDDDDDGAYDDSDEDYDSLQRPAFIVEGELSFDSGPPEDGMEYLRRVRWEAAHIPRVSVAKFDPNKYNAEQSIYMPSIPDVPECPENLLPSKDWEDLFLSYFSRLRTILLFDNCFGPRSATSDNNFEDVLEKLVKLTTEERSSRGIGNTNYQNALATHNQIVTLEGKQRNFPKLSAIMRMDPVTRASMLRKRTSLVGPMSKLPKSECVWLFSLSASVDTPLDADTCASVRGLLRKCAGLRSAKVEHDGEVAMLNILITICGRFFGQCGC